MIPFNFDYYLPDTIREAVEIFWDVKNRGLRPLYYGGGTEIITMSRLNSIRPHAVIDIKKIPECRTHGLDHGNVVFGSALTLSEIAERDLFPLLSKACTRIADHTNQCKITLGGNICGTVIYRESLLPLLLAESRITVAQTGGLFEDSAENMFNNGKRLIEGALLVKISVNEEYVHEKFWHIKKVSAEKIGYPLISAAAISSRGMIRFAFSGACAFPFCLGNLRQIIGGPSDKTIETYLKDIPAPILEDIDGSARYREFVLHNTMRSILCGKGD